MALIPLMPTTRLRNGLEISQIVNGMWQVSGAHGNIDLNKAVLSMNIYAEMGFTTFDMADIYGPAEDIFGSFIKLRDETANKIQALTKLVPRVEDMPREKVESFIDKSLRRMNVDRLDCLQFHWWDYEDKRYLDAIQHLSDIQMQGKIVELSLTNFNSKHLKEIVCKGVSISSNQVQYSIIDRRPTRSMIPFCKEHSIKILAYGTLCGGLVSEKYLGRPEPKHHDLDTASLGKYKQVIDAWGGWVLFQELLETLHSIAREHVVSIANVATRYILNDPTVGAVIIGCRFGVDGCDHAKDNFRSVSSSWNLTDDNMAAIKRVQDKSNNLFDVMGDCGDEYR